METPPALLVPRGGESSSRADAGSVEGSGSGAPACDVPLRLALFSDTYPPQLNGVSRTLERLVRAVRARGGAARIYTTTDPAATTGPGLTGDIWRRPSVPFWSYPQLRISAPVRGRAFADLRAWGPTLVHTATPFGLGLAGRACARALGVPLVTSYHTSFNEYATYYHLGVLRTSGWRYIRWFHNSGARTYVPTRAVMQELGGRGFEHLALWGRGIEAGRFNPSHRSRDVRAQLGADDDTVVVAYVGRLAAEKGLGVALGAMQLLADRARGGGRTGGPRIVFALAGDGPYAAHCRRAAPPAPAAQFVGRLEGQALSEFYASADLFMFPSATDTFGNVLLEAMSSGLPVIAADVGPTRELLAAGGGVTVRPGDPEALAAAIASLAADPERRAAMARLGAAYAAGCSWDRIFDELVADYRQLIVAVPSQARV